MSDNLSMRYTVETLLNIVFSNSISHERLNSQLTGYLTTQIYARTV